jgi:hypothetical protein
MGMLQIQGYFDKDCFKQKGLFWAGPSNTCKMNVAHGSILCTISNKSVPDRDKFCGQSVQEVWTVHHVQNQTLLALACGCWVTLSSILPGGPPCWASPLAFDLIDLNYGVILGGRSDIMGRSDYCHMELYNFLQDRLVSQVGM